MTQELRRIRRVLSRIAELAAEAAGEEMNDVDDPMPTKSFSPKRKRIRSDIDLEAFELRSLDETLTTGPKTHIYGNGVVCETESRGFPTPDNLNPLELILDAPDGTIPLWERNVTLRWRFNENSMLAFTNPAAAKAALEQLMIEALAAWGDAAPVAFTKSSTAWDFEVFMNPVAKCSSSGCVLASAFFPGGGQPRFDLYPTLFRQTRQEFIETLCHEFGHVFGLRHFFAQTQETDRGSELFGSQSQFTIMNYGEDSRLTDTDKNDLKRLYAEVWSGSRTRINGTPIRLVRPFHSSGVTPGSASPFTAAAQGRCPCCH